MKTETVKRTVWRVIAGLGAGVAGASLVIAVQWYCAYMLPVIQSGYMKAWEIDQIWLREFLAVMAVSIAVSVFCFRKLHMMGSAEQEKSHTRKNDVLLMITGACMGVVLRLLGGSALLWYDIKVMESKGVIWLGGYIFTIGKMIATAISCLISTVCLHLIEDEYKTDQSTSKNDR